MGDLKRSKDNKMVYGVLAGIAEKYNWDVGMLRLIYFLIALFSAGVMWIILYLIASMIIPEDTDSDTDTNITKY